MMQRQLVFLAAALLLAPLAPARGADWPHWRGPDFNGSSPETGLPADWSATNRVRWLTKLPGAGSSTPVICGDRVYLTCWNAADNQLRALCLDADSGKELWHHDAGPGFKPKGGNTAATPSAVCDGERVFFLFGTSLLAALDRNGTLLWSRTLAKQEDEYATLFGYGSSPLLHDGRIFIPFLVNSDHPSRLLCVDPVNGRNLWSQERPTDAVAESRDAYTSPIPYRWADKPHVLVIGADYLTAQDAATGREAWRSPNFNPEKNAQFRLIPTPVCAGSNIVCSVNRGTLLLAFRPGEPGGTKPSGWQWKSEDWASDICSPLYYRGMLYALAGDRRQLARLDPVTGNTVWSGDLGTRAKFFASPTAADGRIYCLSLAGEVVVLAAGPKFEILQKVDLAESCSGASVAIARRCLFIRTTHRLYCIGTGPAP